MTDTEYFGQNHNLRLIINDIMKCDDTYILHQCDCVSTEPIDLAGCLFCKYPFANTFKQRKNGTHDVPGTIHVAEGPQGKKIINMYAQYRPRVPVPNSIDDSKEKRLEYFWQCLTSVSTCVVSGETIAIPDHIGCKSSGGEWSSYLGMINDFASLVPSNKITIYRRKMHLPY